MDSEIWVNQRGERFHNESLRGSASGPRALLAQDPPRCWSIIDASMAARVTVSDPAYQQHGAPNRDAIQHLLETSPFIARGATIEEIADAASLDRALGACACAGDWDQERAARWSADEHQPACNAISTGGV